MAFDIGINFRLTAGFVTDGANETYCLGTDGGDFYPTTRAGVTFGWDPFSLGQATGEADRDNTNDRRLAGINYSGISASESFRLILPATGPVMLHLAIGDAGGGLSQTRLTIFDDVNVVATIIQVSTAANHFTDAAGNDWTNVTWPGSEVGLSLTFATTTFNMAVDSPGGGAFAGLAHLRVVQAAPASNFTGGWARQDVSWGYI